MKFGNKTGFLILIMVFAGLLASQDAFSQTKRRIIQLSGVIIGSDTTNNGIPGVHVYVPKAERGATTNVYGFFSLPVLVGDSIVISAVGYQRQYYIVPDHKSEYLTLAFQLEEDVTYLRDVVVTPFPTEEVFKEAVLALNLPPSNSPGDKRNLDAELLAIMLKTMPMDGYTNQRYYLNQWSNSHGDKFMPITNPLLNPFNWAKFIQSVKKNSNNNNNKK